ncbi:MAG: two-component regulator propeller domain-containing protein, partial [Gemmatimonadales bacterium]
MNKSLGIVLLALLGPASAGAQVEDPLLESWRWAYFSAEDGVPSNSIICVLEAADGTVWVASETGFAWFDGYRWRPVNLPVPIRRITAVSLHPGDGVLAAIDGRLWHVRESGTEEVMVDFGTTARGILQAIMLDDGTMLVIAADTSLYHIDANLRRRRVELSARMLLQLRDGSTWLSTPSHLFRFESGEWTSVSLVQPATFLGVDSHGVLTAASTTGPTQTLVTWSSAGNVVTAAVPRDNDVVAFDVAPDGTALAMFESREVYVRLDGRWDYLTDVPEPLLDATFIRFSHSGDLWVGTRDGLYLTHRSQARWTNRTDLMRAPGDRVVSALHVAGNGDVWLGTGSRLIVERADGRIERFDRVRGLAMNGVSGIGEDGDGGIWISNPAAGGIVRFYEGRWRRFDDTDGIATQRIHRIAQSSDGRVWLLGISDLPHTEEGPGAFSFDGRGFTTWDRADGLPSENIYSFGETLDGSIWFGTDSLLARLHGDEWTYYTKSDGLRSNRVATMIGGPDGSLWLGHMHGGFGLGRIFPDGSIRYYDVADGLGNDDVRDLDFGSDGSLWIATRNGVSRFRDGYISQHSAVAGLKHASFLQVAVSRNRILLGSSAGGLYELPVSRMNEPAPVVNIAPPLVGPRQTVLRWKPYSYYGLPHAATIRTRFRMDGLDWSHWSTQHEVAV